MSVSEFRKIEPEQLAKRIRKLALDSHHAVKNPFVTATKMKDLSREIHELRKEARASSLSEIDCWLQHVQRQVEARWPAVRLTTRA
jgi:formiminotetrahydrofolate cyclodeaminase